MAQFSLFWTSSGVGDGVSLTGQVLADWLARTFTLGGTVREGVVPSGPTVSLGVSAASPNVTIAPGSAYVAGYYYSSTATEVLAVPASSSGTTMHRVVLRVNYLTQEVRLALISSSDGVNTLPKFTQVTGQIWEISLASVSVAVNGTMTVTDERDYQHLLMPITRRQGGSSSDWSAKGSQTYMVGGQWWECGTATLVFDDDDDSDTLSVYYPTSFSLRPLVYLTVLNGGTVTGQRTLASLVKSEAGYCQIRARRIDGVDVDATVQVMWLAIGERT